MRASLGAPRARWRWVAGATAVILGAGAGFACSSDSTGPNSQGVVDVVMSPDSVDVALGSTTTITATPKNASGATVSGQTLFWSTSDPSIATVTQSGVVTPVAIGTAIVEASTAGVSPKRPARVVVVPTAVTSIVVAPATVTLRVGGTKQLTDTTKDAAGHILTGRTVLWATSDTNIATTDQSGFIVAHKPGTATITARIGSASGQSTITVSVIPVASLTIAPANPTVILGQSTQLAATTKDSVGNVLSGRVVTWQSSDPTTASVDQTGLVQGVKQGTAKIIASSGVADTVTVTVQPVPINAVLISPQADNLLVGQTLTLTATVTDGAGNPIAGATVTFSSNATGVATVASTGPLTAQVTAIGSGRATITGTSGAKTGTATVTVTEVPVRSVTVTPPVDSITQGHTVQLTATAKDSAGNTLSGRPISWSSSNTAVATVSASGLVTGIGPGTAAIFATSGGVQGNATVTVLQIPVGSVVISPSTDTVSVSAQRQLTVVVKDSLGSVINSPTVAWSSTNGNSAAVSSNGVVIGVQPGTAQIIAQSGAKADTNTTVVIPASVASVNVSIGANTIAAGQTTTVTATSKDGSGNVLQGRTVTWSSDATGTATVSAGGIDPNTQLDTATVTGVSVGGPATITAKSANNVSGNTQVTVASPVNHIVVSPNVFTVNVLFTQQLAAQARDVNDQPINGVQFTWTTKSGGTKASVDGNGLVTGVAAGTDSVFASNAGKTGGAAVTVTNAPVASVIVTPASSQMTNEAGQSVQLSDTLKDSHGNVLTGRTVTWTSNDNAIATVSNTGLVQPSGTPPDTGTVTITAKSGGPSGTATVHVTNPPVTSVTVGPSPDTIYTTTPNNTLQLTATTVPANDGGVTWSSANTSIVSVSPSGVITGVGYGAPTGVTATSTTTPATRGSASVLVLGHPVADTVTPNAATLGGGITVPDTVTLTVVLRDASGTDISGQQPVIWTSSDPNVTINGGATPVTVSPANSNGVFIQNIGATAGAAVTITATTLDGHTAVCTVSISFIP